MSNDKIEAGDWVKCGVGTLDPDKEYKVLYKNGCAFLLETEEDNGLLRTEDSVKAAGTNELAEIYRQLIYNNTYSLWVTVASCTLSRKYDDGIIVHAQNVNSTIDVDRGGFRYL